mgnify:CR=1 FL=1|tara:strand:- start:3417 stop:4121 length:705 start_codon:yes stop_codon:yes gene_type:complete
MAIGGLINKTIGAVTAPSGGFASVDDLIQARTPQALSILQQGSNQQLDLSRQATQSSLDPLQQVDDLRGFNEQQAILGLQGGAAQEQAIGSIPVSQFNRELQRRQQQQLNRGASARGELGGGASIQAGQQLAGAQQANIIQQRLAQLEPLAALSRSVRGDMASVIEGGAVNEANIQQGLGTQMANIRLGSTAPQIQGIQNAAEISGLQGISSANQRAQTNNQLASLAGTFFGGS